MKKLLLSFYFFAITINANCQMFINDPQDWWGEGPASIENVEIEVRTIGAYSETAIAFDLMLSDPYYFQGVDLLEFTFDFQLNEGAVVNDSWLWINDYISEGEIYEQGEGTQIYESIVDRQQDPSILTQLSSTEYNLKVYPLKWDSTRRVRISYLEPLTYLGKRANSKLPLGLLKHSSSSPENIKITIFDDENYTNEGLNTGDWMVEEVGSGFKVYRNNYVFYQSDFEDIPINFSFKNPDADYFLSTYAGVDDNYYQLVYYPEINIASSVEHRMIVFDYDSFSSELSFEDVKGKLRSALLEMDENDYFIICNSDFTTKFSSDNWEQATAANIELALSGIELNSTFFESKLSTLLPEALYRVEALDQSAEIILLSPNSEYYSGEKAESFLSLIDEFYDNMTTEATISVFDYAGIRPGGYVNGILTYGNDYVYYNLTEIANGSYFSTEFGDDIYTSLVELFSTSATYTDQYDFHLSVDGGFTYSNFDNLKSDIQLGGEKPIISTGKYFGDGMFDVQFTAKLGDQVYIDAQKLDANFFDGLDERTESVWYSEFIKSLQHSGDYEDKRDVIETSIEQRLLSVLTVFLCLEPGFESISANNGDDGGIILTSTEDESESDFTVRAYPNPFIERLSIEFPFEKSSYGNQLVINILDSKGQLIEHIVKTKGLIDGMNTIEWIPQHELTDGVYILQIHINDTMYSQKVIRLKS